MPNDAHWCVAVDIEMSYGQARKKLVVDCPRARRLGFVLPYRVESCSYSRVVVSVGVVDEDQPLLEEVAQHRLEEVVQRRLEEVMQPRREEVVLLSRRWG